MGLEWAIRVVFAQMIIDGKHYGVKSFLVQLRDPTTFDLKPGVSIGDCGAKMVRVHAWDRTTSVAPPLTPALPPLRKRSCRAVMALTTASSSSPTCASRARTCS